MSDKKQSSIEWLINEIDMQFPHIDIRWKERMIEQAKAMHREEHLETWVESAVQHRKENHYRKKKILFFEEYYNETFGE